MLLNRVEKSEIHRVLRPGGRFYAEEMLKAQGSPVGAGTL